MKTKDRRMSKPRTVPAKKASKKVAPKKKAAPKKPAPRKTSSAWAPPKPAAAFVAWGQERIAEALVAHFAAIGAPKIRRVGTFSAGKISFAAGHYDTEVEVWVDGKKRTFGARALVADRVLDAYQEDVAGALGGTVGVGTGKLEPGSKKGSRAIVWRWSAPASAIDTGTLAKVMGSIHEKIDEAISSTDDLNRV